MQWMPLKLDLLPAISIETERTVELLRELAFKVGNGQFREQSKLQELKNQLRKRIDQLDQFYDTHCHDSRVALFHRLKLQIMKALANNTEQKLEQTASHAVVSSTHATSKSPIGRESAKPLATMESTLSRSSQPLKGVKARQNVTALTSQKSSKPNMAHSSTQFKELNRQLKKFQHQPRQSTRQSKPSLPTKEKVAEPTKKPVPELPKPDYSRQPKAKTSQAVSQELDSIVAMPPPPSEIVFTIKMTKEEYLEFLSAKQTRK